MKTSSILTIEGTELRVSNLEKVYYPEVPFSKGEVIQYYIQVARVLLPHLLGRPVTLKRYPDGVDGLFFYERHCPTHRPEWIKTAAVKKSEGGRVDYCLVDSLPALIWAVNLGTLELHPFLHHHRAIHRPTVVAFDLDPGPPAGVLQCAQVALHLHALFMTLGLESFVKTSGSKGLQVYVPLNTPVTYTATKRFAHQIAKALESQFPKLVVSQMAKELRRGKVLVDWSQNDDHKTTVAVYSLRARSRPTGSTPLTWNEVKRAVQSEDAEQLRFETAQMLERIRRRGDLFAPILSLRQKLPRLTI